MLRLGETPTVSSEAFLAACADHLTADQLTCLTEVGLLPDGRPCCAVEAAWQDWETYVRNHLAAGRAARWHRPPDASRHPEADAFPSVQRELDEALGAADPLAREKALDRCRWQRLGDLDVLHDFDFEALVLFRLRLLLVEKWAAWDAAAGAQELGTLLAHAVGQADAARREHD